MYSTDLQKNKLSDLSDGFKTVLRSRRCRKEAQCPILRSDYAMLGSAWQGRLVWCVPGQQPAAPGHHELPACSLSCPPYPLQCNRLFLIYDGYYYKSLNFKTPSTSRWPRLPTLRCTRGGETSL